MHRHFLTGQLSRPTFPKRWPRNIAARAACDEFDPWVRWERNTWFFCFRIGQFGKYVQTFGPTGSLAKKLSGFGTYWNHWEFCFLDFGHPYDNIFRILDLPRQAPQQVGCGPGCPNKINLLRWWPTLSRHGGQTSWGNCKFFLICILLKCLRFWILMVIILGWQVRNFEIWSLT